MADRASVIERQQVSEPEHFDVVIVGAGLSGIGSAVHLQRECPGRTYTILEGRDAIGGTWDLFRYPGIRSDSDMYTLGYRFKPWPSAKAIADGPAIRAYVNETAAENDVVRHIRFRHRVRAADWSSADARWTITAERADTGETVRLTCAFLHMCSGYYSYDDPHAPTWPGQATFTGRVIHPQHWPEGLDYAGKRVVVIGSGATAVTIVPVMAQTAAHVVMLQRSPTYMVSGPSVDRVAEFLKKVLPSMTAYQAIRWKNVLFQQFFYKLARTRPQAVAKKMIGEVQKLLPAGYDVGTHFTPRYNPWDQRICLVPDADMFEALSKGQAEIVTDQIERFDEGGIVLKSGRRLDADIIVTATGLKLNVLGDVAVSIDGVRQQLGRHLSYKGLMLSDIPNMAYSFGYLNASWTLKADLTCGFVCRLLNHMKQGGYDIAIPRRAADVEEEPFADFSSGYIARALDYLPKQGSKKPWKLYQSYSRDLVTLRYGKLDDGTMTFLKRGTAPVQTRAPAPVREAAE